MKKQYGFTVVELMIGVAIFMIILASISNFILNSRGATEARALESAQSFIYQNGIEVKRLTCAGDSNNDGYGTCNIVTKDKEKIILSCPTNFWDVKLFGATQCKEVLYNVNLNQQMDI